jgi:hypothetical protein
MSEFNNVYSVAFVWIGLAFVASGRRDHLRSRGLGKPP